MRRRDVLTAVAIGTLASVLALLESGTDPRLDATPGTVAGTLVIASTFAFHRRRPRAAWIVALAGFGVAAATGTGMVLAPYVLVWIAAFRAGRDDGARWSILAAFGIAAISEAMSLAQHMDAAMYSFLAPGIWFAGRAVRSREQVAVRLRERARELEEEREAYARLSVRYERARIASELHDIVAHAISVMVVQAGAGQRLVGVDRGLAAETFTAIAGAARQAEEDMGRLLALLADRDAIGEAPDLSLVEKLVRQAGGSGLDVDLRLEGEREGLPAATVETACRVVQEGLTNAIRYATGARVRVLVRGAADELFVEVANEPARAERRLAGAGTGNGLRGLRERAAACGGRLEAGSTDDGGWRVTAHLPRRVAVAA
jgi:signal transduction histidine kinase